MRKLTSPRRGLYALWGAAVAVLGMAVACATSSAGNTYARIICASREAGSERRRARKFPGAVQRSINSVKADQIREVDPVGMLLGNSCYAATGLSGIPFGGSLEFNWKTSNTNGHSRKINRLNS